MTITITDNREVEADKTRTMVQDLAEYIDKSLNRLPETAEEIAALLADTIGARGKGATTNPLATWVQYLPLLSRGYTIAVHSGKAVFEYGNFKADITLPDGAALFMEGFNEGEFPFLISAC